MPVSATTELLREGTGNVIMKQRSLQLAFQIRELARIRVVSSIIGCIQ